MVRMTVHLEPGELGAALAHKDATEQAAFLKAFCSELFTICGTNHAAEMQMAFVNEKLDPEERSLMSMVGYSEDQ